MSTRKLWPGVRQLPNGHFNAYVRVGDQQRTKRFPPDTKLGAIQNWREEMRVSLRAIRPKGVRGTLAGDIVTFLKGLADRPALQSERQHQLAWWAERFGHRARSSITSQEIVNALAERRVQASAPRRAGDPTPPGGAASTCNHSRMALMALYMALDKGTAAPNPVAEVNTYSAPPAEPRGLSYDLVKLILDAMADLGAPLRGVKGHRLEGSMAKARLTVIAYTGMRHSELKRFVAQDWNREQHSLVVRTGKGGRTRTIPLVTEAESALAHLITINGLGPFSNSPVRRAFELACEKLDIRGIRPYDLRHTYGTWMYAASGDLRIVAAMMGHSQTRTTERYTLGYVPDYMRVVTQRFQTMLNPETTSPEEPPKPKLALVPAPARRRA